MLYTARGNKARGITLADEGGNTIGAIEYTGWLSRKAQFVMYNGDVYQVASGNFWVTAFDILHAEIKTGEISMRMNGRHIITLNGNSYRLRRKGLFNMGFVFSDAEDRDIATIQRRFEWQRFTFTYDIEWDGSYSNKDMAVLMLAIVYACNQHYARAA